MKNRIVLVSLALLLAVGVVTIGCPVPVPVNDVVVPPAPVIEWVGQTVWPAGMPLHGYLVEWARRVGEITDGQLQITLHPAGAMVPAGEVFAATKAGFLDVGHAWPPWWRGKDPAFLLFCPSAVGMDKHEAAIWLWEFGGWELMKELYGRFNIFPMPVTAAGPEVFLWGPHPIRTLEDLKGLKVRSAGLSLDIFAELGALAVWMPTGEIVPALEKGVVDAAEFAQLYTDVPLGFHLVARYMMIGPGRAPSNTDELLINLDSWKALPEDLRQAVIAATRESHLLSIAKSEVHNAEFLAYIKAFGTVIVEVEEEVLVAMEQVRDNILDAYAAKCPFFARVLESQRRFLELYRPFADMF